MSKQELEKILDRVKKLLALAGNNPNEHEAASAAEMAKRILNEYNLSLTDVEVNEILTKEVVFNSLRLDKWKGILANMISKVFDCFAYKANVPRTEGKTKIVFVGTKADAEVAYYVYSYLVTVISHLIDEKVKDNAFGIHGNELRTSYSMGILSTLDQRLKDFYGKINEETKVGVSGLTGKELIVVKQNAIEKWKKEQASGFKNTKYNYNYNVDAYVSGQQDGNAISLTHGIKYNGRKADGYLN